MNCRTVIRELALHLGKDACERDAMDEVRHHLKECPECRAKGRRLKESQTLLENAHGQETYVDAGSLWPALKMRLDEPQPSVLSSLTVRNWAPVATIISACLLVIVSIGWSLPQGDPSHSAPVLHSRDTGTMSIFGGSDFHLPRTSPRQAPEPERPKVDLKELKKELDRM